MLICVIRKYIQPLFADAAVYLYGSYSKGTAKQDSDIDVAVVVPHINENWFSVVPPMWKCAREVNSLIEPVLMEADSHSPLYDDVMRTGVAV